MNNTKRPTKKVRFEEGMIVQVKGVYFKIKRIKPSKNEMTIRIMTSLEVKKLEEHIAKEKVRERLND